MRLSFLRQIGAAFAIGISLGGTALAQSQACESWRSELASLQGQAGGDPRAAQAARRTGAALSQSINQYRAMGCERRGFLFFGEQAPPQCGGLRAQIDRLQAQYDGFRQQAEGGGSERRRAQLAALIEGNCRGAPQQRGFFETIFGLDPRRGEIEAGPSQPDDMGVIEPERPRLGGNRAVCVRTCDGFFFPLSNSPGGRDSADEMCQALCPGTETMSYFMAQGGDIQNAVSRAGVPYSSLPNAGKYTRSFDAACTCKAPGQSWAGVLRHAEDMLETRKGDIIVTAEQAEAMSRPKADPKADAKRRTATASQAPVPAPPVVEDLPMPSENSPTSGTESAGVGPQVIESQPTLDTGDGLKRESRSVTGERRTVRIVAPSLAPNLNPTAARP